MLWGIEYMGPVRDAPDVIIYVTTSRSTAKAVRQEHRMPFACSLRHALRLCHQPHAEWLQNKVGVEGISLNRKKSQAPLASGVLPHDLTEKQPLAVDSRLTVVGQGMGVVRVTMGTEQVKWDFVDRGSKWRTSQACKSTSASR